VETLFKLILRIFMAFVGLLFLLVLLCALLGYVVWGCLRWLVTGRKPQVVLVWQQFRAMRQNFAQGGFRAGTASDARDSWNASASWSASSGPAANDQVVDVEVREVVEDAPRLPARKPD
jgi:hypothetical protein